jgi:protein-glutamine gamma-glutamyltransferase
MEKKTKQPEIDSVALRWLLATGAMACASIAAELPIWISLVFATSLGWRYVIERFHLRRPRRFLRFTLAVLVVVGVSREFGTVLGRDPGLSLLLALLGLKLLELRGLRDAMFTLFLFYVVLVGAFLFNQTLLTAIWSVACIVASVATLIRLQQPIPVRAVLRLAPELVVKAVPLLLVLYILFPRVGDTFWGVSTQISKGSSGIPEEVRPGAINELSASPEIAFRADFINGVPPPARQLYWRALVLWDSDGKSWKRGSAGVTPAGGRARTLGPPVQYRVTLEPHSSRWLFALDLPFMVPTGAAARPDFTLVRTDVVRERVSYDVISHLRYATAELSPLERQRALALPPVSARVRAYADYLHREHADPMARVQAVLQYIRNEHFVYTLTPPLLGDDPVDQFFFETRRGFCEHYASAFATLMRAAGIPARIVVGYQGGEINPSGNYLIVRQADAHAWVEVALPGRGWVRIDPTAAVAPERVELGIDAIRRLEAQGLVPGAVSAEALARALNLGWLERVTRGARLYWDYTNLAWYRFVVDYRKENQEWLLHALGFETIQWSRVLILLGGACALLLIGYVAWARRGPALDPAQRWYLRFCRKLQRGGVTRAPHEGPLAFCERACGIRPDLAPVIRTVTAHYLNLRYAPNASNDELRLLAQGVRELRSRQLKSADFQVAKTNAIR